MKRDDGRKKAKKAKNEKNEVKGEIPMFSISSSLRDWNATPMTWF